MTPSREKLALALRLLKSLYVKECRVGGYYDGDLCDTHWIYMWECDEVRTLLTQDESEDADT